MTQIQLTTREAVETALDSMRLLLDLGYPSGKDKAEIQSAIRLLCDLYGFKLEQFFGKKLEKTQDDG